MSLHIVNQTLRSSRSIWLGLIIALSVGQVGTAADYSHVDPVTGVPNYYDALFGEGDSAASMRTNAGYANFGPDPSGHRFHDRASDRPTSPHETYKPSFDHNDLWQGRPIAPAPADPTEPEPDEDQEPTGRELVDLRLTARYGDPVVVRFIKGTSIRQFANLVLETSRLIDSRHIEPTTYEARVAQAAENLRVAVRNQEFRRVFGLNVSAAQEQAFDQELNRYLAKQSMRNVNDMLRAMTGIAAIAQRQLGLPATAVAAEFVYGATESLDKYSAFNPEAPRSMPSASTGLENSVVGIGVEIKPHEQGVIVLKAIRNSPAKQGGLQRGDIITGVNGERLGGRTMDFAVDRIAGPVGSPVMLNIVRDGRTMQLSLRRDRVRVYSVNDVQMLDPIGKIGYIKLDKFAESSTEEMKEALWSLYRQGMESLVLDLRGNPGGLLTTAIEISDLFLPSGTIVSTRGRTAQDNMLEEAARPKTWKIPLVVLVDENSASASEIFAAAIQENGRGLIVGQTSYGKGTVQTHFPLQSINGNLKITTARFFSPDGRVMAGSGVTPDVIVPEGERDESVVPLLSEIEVRRAMQVAAGTKVRQMAHASENGQVLSRR